MINDAPCTMSPNRATRDDVDEYNVMYNEY